MPGDIKTSRSLRVFLCHCLDDHPLVLQLYRQLWAAGAAKWPEEQKIRPGPGSERFVPYAVADCDILLLYLSHNSITASGFVRKELRQALDVADQQLEGMIALVTIRGEDCTIPGRVAPRPTLDLFEDGGYEKLLSALANRAAKLGCGFRGASITANRLASSTNPAVSPVQGLTRPCSHRVRPFFRKFPFIVPISLALGAGGWRWLKPVVDSWTPRLEFQVLFAVILSAAGFGLVFSISLGLILLFGRSEVLEQATIQWQRMLLAVLRKEQYYPTYDDAVDVTARLYILTTRLIYCLGMWNWHEDDKGERCNDPKH